MAVRPIDANELYRIEKLLDTDIVRQDKVALNLLEQVLYDIQHVPTLTPQNGWVSVEERLPEVYLDEEDISIPFLVCGPYTKYPFRAFFSGTFWLDPFEPVEVTYWMPLPEPPDRRQPEEET